MFKLITSEFPRMFYNFNDLLSVIIENNIIHTYHVIISAPHNCRYHMRIHYNGTLSGFIYENPENRQFNSGSYYGIKIPFSVLDLNMDVSELIDVLDQKVIEYRYNSCSVAHC